jgi:hypothetical protein
MPRTVGESGGLHGFARDEIMAWCEENGVDYVLGLAKNPRLIRRISRQAKKARQKFGRAGKSARVFRSFRYRTKDSWSRTRRVVGKGEHLEKGSNPRFVVTSLETPPPQALYEDIYCARGEMENRIKEQQLDLFANRTSTSVLRANKLRLYLSSFAYVLLQCVRRVGLQGTELARAMRDDPFEAVKDRCASLRVRTEDPLPHVLRLSLCQPLPAGLKTAHNEGHLREMAFGSRKSSIPGNVNVA